MIRDLNCKSNVTIGEIDLRVVRSLRKRYPLSDAFISQMAGCQGLVPQIANFKVNSESQSLARFLTLLDEKSEIPGPFRPHFEHCEMDERVVIGIPYLLDYEHQTSRTLFDGLVPFGATQDDMCLDRGYVDLVCLDFRKTEIEPPVVLWNGHNALLELMRWEKLEIEQQFDENENYYNVRWESFLTPLAVGFEQFINLLESTTP